MEHVHAVECQKSGCGLFMPANTREAAIDAWNKRVTELSCKPNKKLNIASVSDEDVERFIKRLPWTSSVGEYEKTLVIGNIRNFWSVLKEGRVGCATNDGTGRDPF